MYVLSHNWLLKDTFLLTFLPSQKPLYLSVAVREIFSASHMWRIWVCGESWRLCKAPGALRNHIVSEKDKEGKGKGVTFPHITPIQNYFQSQTPGMLSTATEPLGTSSVMGAPQIEAEVHRVLLAPSEGSPNTYPGLIGPN